MLEPPVGTITFLITDIEGSTQRWEKEPEIMRIALAEHDDKGDRGQRRLGVQKHW